MKPPKPHLREKFLFAQNNHVLISMDGFRPSGRRHGPQKSVAIAQIEATADFAIAQSGIEHTDLSLMIPSDFSNHLGQRPLLEHDFAGRPGRHGGNVDRRGCGESPTSPYEACSPAVSTVACIDAGSLALFTSTATKKAHDRLQAAMGSGFTCALASDRGLKSNQPQS